MQSLILECDIGNSRCKWRSLAVDGSIVERGCFDHRDGFAGLPDLGSITRIRVASVAGDQVLQQFLTRLAGSTIEPEFAVSTVSAVGVTNAYAHAAGRLGVDRWLAVVAAYQRQQGAALVIDVGSALTVDLVAANGRHLGGYIVPGAELMMAALRAETGKVRFERCNEEVGLGFGCSTADAVHAGILASQIGTVRVAIAEANRQISTGFAILLTGGGAAAVASYLQDEVIEVPDLVLDGLVWLLP
jgi:type III pantothenate kinase